MRAVISPGFRPFAIGLLLVSVGPSGDPGFRPGPAPLSAQDARPMTVEDVLELKSLSQLSMSPDGRWVAYVVTGRDMEEDRQETDVWVVPATGGPADARQLTFRPGSDDSPVWHPSGDWLAFSSDREGERQVYGIRPDGGEAWQVTSHETSVGGFRFAPDGRRLGFTASPPPTEADRELEELRGRPMVWDSVYTDQWSQLYVAELEDDVAGEAVRWSPDGLHVQALVWSPDSRALAFGARSSPVLRTNYHGATYVQSGPETEARSVTSMEGGENPVAWDDEAGLIVSGSGHLLGTFNRQLWRVPFAEDGTALEAVSLTAGLDANANLVHVDGSRLIVAAARRTGATLYRIDLEDGAAAGAPLDLTDGRHYYTGASTSDDGSVLAFTAEDGAAPPDIFVTGSADFRPERLTDVNPRVADLALGEQRVERWSSRAGGEEIEGVLILPVGYEEGDRVPLVLVIHGGPSGISSDRFNGTRGAYPVQVYAGMGLAVLQPNYRGSSGYGERFRGLNRGDISGRDWIDIDSGVDAMIERGIADPDRLAVSGWSFGGHHTYWGITQTDRFKAASAGAGANDLISMYSQTDIPEFYHTYLGPKPWEDWELYEERSAYRHVENVSTPLLIQVGEKDERVPAEQSIQFFEAVRAIGKAPTELVLYPDQPHGVRSPRLQRDLMSRNVVWLERWVLEPEALVP
ncbi:prolyl oligopeptidase family serine peptidase [Candidatus Palauibacter sp.]|uniref:prolyl oligopeptidase family serine peptidase n=1 Tax=Candidatus Palauibacter sp. TaxID=3101350 RepID=UPI003AF2B864